MPVNPELFAAYFAAIVVLFLIPGPIVTFVLAQSLSHGSRTGLAAVGGAALGNACLIVLSGIGLTAFLSLMAGIVEWVRWLGVAYLIWLGLREWRAALARATAAEAPPAPRHRHVFGGGFLIAITNPKTILFFAAFFPQFLDSALPLAGQIAAMSAAAILIAPVCDSLYALGAGRARRWLTAPRTACVRQGITGTLLIGTAAGLALARRGP